MRFKILAILAVLAGSLAVAFGWSRWREWQDVREGRIRPIAPGILDDVERYKRTQNFR